jgi:signal transduction histidine kinase
MNETILVVDDTPVNLQVVADVLSHAGYRIQVAEDGESAIELANTCKPDLILLDIMMPQMDGFETCKRLKSHQNTKAIPILFMTAVSNIADKIKGFELGAVDYIVKPFQQEEVLARVQTHLTLSKQKRDLEKLLEERNQFMNMAIHDLRNPIFAIIGWSKLGGMSPKLDEAHGMLDRIQDASNWLYHALNHFLTLQNLSAQQDKPKAAPFDLRRLLKLAIDQHRVSAEKKNIKLLCDPPQSLEKVVGNNASTHQIVSNYLSNAIKYSPLGSSVVVAANSNYRCWRVEVKDQGPGIPVEERSMLFKEFARISSLSTGGETGARLGLAIVKKLAEAQGGKAGADFPESGGSVFWIEVPNCP